jgi:hypothetical protein
VVSETAEEIEAFLQQGFVNIIEWLFQTSSFTDLPFRVFCIRLITPNSIDTECVYCRQDKYILKLYSAGMLPFQFVLTFTLVARVLL